MTGFKLRTFGIGSDRSTNLATTPAPPFYYSYLYLFGNGPPRLSICHQRQCIKGKQC